MMEHENTKEARRKLQEYKQKLGKEFFVEFLHRSTRCLYNVLSDFVIFLHGRTDVIALVLLMFFNNSDHFKLLLVYNFSHFYRLFSSSSFAWFCCFNCCIFSLALLNFFCLFYF